MGRNRNADGHTQKKQITQPSKNRGDHIDEDVAILRANPPMRGPATDCQSLPQRNHNSHISEKVKALAKQLADRADGSQKARWSMDALMNIAFAAGAADFWIFEDMLDATDTEKTKLFKQMPGAMDRLVRLLITAEQP